MQYTPDKTTSQYRVSCTCASCGKEVQQIIEPKADFVCGRCVLDGRGDATLGYVTKLPASGLENDRVEVSIYDNQLKTSRIGKARNKRDQWKLRLKIQEGLIIKRIVERSWMWEGDDYNAQCRKMVDLHQKLASIRRDLSTNGKSRMYGWSNKSRLALIRRLMQVTMTNFSAPYFLSMTYHENFPDAHQAKKHLKNWFARLLRVDNPKGTKKRDLIRFGYVWKLEFQERGAPHFHVILFPAKSSKLQGKKGAEIIQNAWHDIAGNDSKAHKKYGTDVQRVECLNSFKKMYRYTAKYACKQVEAQDANGRFWGTSTNAVDENKTMRFEMGKAPEVQLRRIAKRLLRGVKPFHGKQHITQKGPRFYRDFEIIDGERVEIPKREYKTRLRNENPNQSQKIGDLYYEIPKNAGFYDPGGKWHDLTRYSKMIVKDFLGWDMHLGLTRHNAERLIQWCIDGSKYAEQPKKFKSLSNMWTLSDLLKQFERGAI